MTNSATSSYFRQVFFSAQVNTVTSTPIQVQINNEKRDKQNTYSLFFLYFHFWLLSEERKKGNLLRLYFVFVKWAIRQDINMALFVVDVPTCSHTLHALRNSIEKDVVILSL